MSEDASISAGELEEARAWRRELHRAPEFGLETPQTARFVADRLASFGIETHTGVGGTGVVGVLHRGNARRRVGLRADMDALQIAEQNRFDHASLRAGFMHACGHDGHTCMLLAAARRLAGLSPLDVEVVFIFQPGEEHGLGARAMIDDGLFERFPVDEVYALHNLPGLPVGTIATRPGPIMAAEDNFEITLTGTGGHAARPHLCDDVLGAGCQLVLALQTIVARRTDPLAQAVVSVTEILSDGVRNALPGRCVIRGDTRSYDRNVQQTIEREMRRITDGVAMAFGLAAEVAYSHEFAPTVNTPAETARAYAAARAVGGAALREDCEPLMASDDFGVMLEHRPGAYGFLGNGETGAAGGEPLHSACYDFNDAVMRYGAEYFVRLVLDASQT